jgi:hypothetical protein
MAWRRSGVRVERKRLPANASNAQNRVRVKKKAVNLLENGNPTRKRMPRRLAISMVFSGAAIDALIVPTALQMGQN